MPDEFTTSFRATVRYENDVMQDATATAAWTVEPAKLASVARGELAAGEGNHLLASTVDATYAVDLASRQSVWSYPVGAGPPGPPLR